MTPALLRLARCRHPSAHTAGCGHVENCTLCGSAREVYSTGVGRWTRPKLVADLIAEKKGKGK